MTLGRHLGISLLSMRDPPVRQRWVKFHQEDTGRERMHYLHLETEFHQEDTAGNFKVLPRIHSRAEETVWTLGDTGLKDRIILEEH